MRLTVATGAAVVLSGVLWARADTILKGAPGSNPLPQDNVRVTGVANGELTYTTATGSSRTVALADVQKVTADGQPAFNGAEDAYAAHDVAAALDGYESVLNGSGPDWLRARSALRLADVGRTQHRYDAQVAAYAALVGIDPALAADARPAAPQPNNPRLDAAQTALSRAMASTAAAKRSPLLSVQLDIARAKGDRSAVTATLQQLSAAGGATPADQAMLKLAAADVALDAKQYAQAEADVQQNRGLFTDPAQQVEALWVLAQARDGQATGTPDATKDAAIAYVRVVTFGTQLPDRPHVAESLVRAAQLEEKLGDPKGAATLYQQLASDRSYAGSTAATDAHAALDRLKK